LFRPDSSGEIVPNRALATAGGPPIHFTINALDGKSVYRVLTDAQGEVVRFLRETVRDGRW
jgi:hypothetical protein